MRKIALFLLICTQSFAQADTQERFVSDSRQYFIWSDDTQSYILRETEYENSVIDIREIGSKSNGYIAISLVDDGRSRLFHGSITAFSVNDKQEPTWQLRSKTMRSKLTLNPADHTLTYLYDANDKRYQKILVFSLKPTSSDQASSSD